MVICELLDLVASEPERRVMREVCTNSPEVLARLARPGGIPLGDFLSAPDLRKEVREVRYLHVLAPPASPRAIDAWLAAHPSWELPDDLRELVMHVNGVHLWANAEAGRSYIGLAPLEEWRLWTDSPYGDARERRSEERRYLATSYHQDGGDVVSFDRETGRYFLTNGGGADTAECIGEHAGDVLDWLWRTRMPPR